MRAILTMALVGAVVGGAGSALAQSRPDSLTMTCTQAQALVRKQGAVVIGTGPFIYDRFVVDRNFCTPTQRANNAFIQTKDNKYCLVGGICREATPFEPFR